MVTTPTDEAKDTEETIEFEIEDAPVRENPGLGDFKDAVQGITWKKVVFPAMGLLSPVIVPKIIVYITGRSELAQGIIGMLVGFLGVILVSMAVHKLEGTEAAAEYVMIGGLAALTVSAAQMIAGMVQSRMIPAAAPVAGRARRMNGIGAQHELYTVDTAGVQGSLGALENLAKDVIAPNYVGGMDAVGGGTY